MYRQDITKFARGYEAKVLAVFDELPSQLSKTEKNINFPKSAKGQDSETTKMLLCGWQR